MDWNTELARIVVNFSYDEMLIEEVKSIPGRRWHRDHKFWSLPIESAGEAARILIPLGFETSEQLEKLLTGEVEGLAGMAQEEPAGDQVDVQVDVQEDNSWSVSRLNETVREALLLAVPQSIWLVGEVLEFDRNQHKEHVFFRIAEKLEDDDKPRSSVTAVLWQGNREKVLDRFAETGSVLEDGLKVRVKVRVDFYPVNGSYQVVVEDIDPSYTLGEIARRRERILAEIAKQGLTEKNRSLPWPEVPLRVGVITSPGSDAWKDFVDEIDRSGYSFSVDLYGVHVQGERTEKEVLAGLAYFEQRAEDFDVVLLIRGGGSRADLLSFDTLPLALAVAQHPLKIVVGIGHQADRSVLDEIAHSQKTPTAAGQELVQRVEHWWQQLREQAVRIMGAAALTLQTQRSDLNWLRTRVVQGVEWAILDQKRSLENRGGVIRSSALGHIGEARGHLRAGQQRLVDAAPRTLRLEELARGRARGFLLDAVQRQLSREKERCKSRQERVRSSDPAVILSRGFAWVRGESGQTIRSAREPKVDEVLQVRFRDGSIKARVKRSE